MLITTLVIAPGRLGFIVQRRITGVSLSFQNLTSCSWWNRLCWSLVDRHYICVVLDVVNINTIDAIVKVSNVQSQVAIVH